MGPPCSTGQLFLFPLKLPTLYSVLCENNIKNNSTKTFVRRGQFWLRSSLIFINMAGIKESWKSNEEAPI
jgi:hypothetical protein